MIYKIFYLYTYIYIYHIISYHIFIYYFLDELFMNQANQVFSFILCFNSFVYSLNQIRSKPYINQTQITHVSF